MNSKLFRHYKGKDYKFKTIVKHSETLEDLVLYDCLYENSEGKTWVRPKNLFFGEMEINGKSAARFQEIPLAIETTIKPSEDHIKTIGYITQESIGEWDLNWFYSTFKSYHVFHLAIAHLDNKPVGYKLGYERDKRTFYSWIGGVLPQYRSLGVASELMKTQHEWCRTQGYHKVQTKTQNRFRDMLILNLKFGFNIIATHESSRGKGLKIVLEKTLASRET